MSGIPPGFKIPELTPDNLEQMLRSLLSGSVLMLGEDRVRQVVEETLKRPRVEVGR